MLLIIVYRYTADDFTNIVELDSKLIQTVFNMKRHYFKKDRISTTYYFIIHISVASLATEIRSPGSTITGLLPKCV